MKRSNAGVAAAFALTVLLAGVYVFYRFSGVDAAAPVWRLAKVESGPITAAVSATGTLNPVVSVQVGSQVSGQIKEIYVDFNSVVKSGQIIARIDPEIFRYRVRQAEADLEATRAAVLTQQAAIAAQRAEIARVEANLREAQRDYERKRTLVEKNFISPADRDKAQAVFEAAAAQLDAARAQLRVAEAQAKNGEAVVRQREAQLAQSRVDLAHTEIRAPVDGVVVKRSVDTGQTVAASLQAPELFVIARNLSDMQVDTSIDEADVGRVRVGQQASFTVDSFPGRSFNGEVMQVRKAAQVVSNVVTYTVVVSAANPDLGLLPGMTANVRIVTAHEDRVLKVPNAALRFRPPSNGEAKRGPAADVRRGEGSGGGRVWVPDGKGPPRALRVQSGLTDGTTTEIVSSELTEGTEVIVGSAGPATPIRPAGPRLF